MARPAVLLCAVFSFQSIKIKMLRTPTRRRSSRTPPWFRDYIRPESGLVAAEDIDTDSDAAEDKGDEGAGRVKVTDVRTDMLKSDSSPVTRLSLHHPPHKTRSSRYGSDKLNHKLNHEHQLSKLVNEATKYTTCACSIQPRYSGKQVMLTLSPPGYFLAVAVPALLSFSVGHQVSTSGHTVSCNSVTPYYAGEDVERVKYGFETKSLGAITVTMSLSTRSILVQGGPGKFSVAPSATQFVCSILNCWLEEAAIGQDTAINEINKAILSLSKQSSLSPSRSSHRSSTSSPVSSVMTMMSVTSQFPQLFSPSHAMCYTSTYLRLTLS